MGERKGADREQGEAGLGFGDLSMNEVPPSAPVADQEAAPQRRSRTGLIVALVLVAVAAFAFGIRTFGNLAPGQEAQDRLRQAVAKLPAWQKGDLMQADYATGSTVRLEFASRLNTSSEADREAIRQAARGVFELLRLERPDRDLYLEATSRATRSSGASIGTRAACPRGRGNKCSTRPFESRATRRAACRAPTAATPAGGASAPPLLH